MGETEILANAKAFRFFSFIKPYVLCTCVLYNYVTFYNRSNHYTYFRESNVLVKIYTGSRMAFRKWSPTFPLLNKKVKLQNCFSLRKTKAITSFAHAWKTLRRNWTVSVSAKGVEMGNRKKWLELIFHHASFCAV